MMEKLKMIMPSEIMFVILLLIGIILNFINSEHILILMVLYLGCQLFCVSFINYSSKQLLEMKDLYCTILIGCLLILLFHDWYNFDEWFYLIFTVGISTAYLGCNQRFSYNHKNSPHMAAINR